MLSPIWADGPCWSEIRCPVQDDIKVDEDGLPEYCTIAGINVAGGSGEQILIEIISPNLYGADAHHWFIINKASPYLGGNYQFLVGGMSSPVYVLCSDYITPTFGDYTSGKGYLINRWSSADIGQEILVNATNLVGGALTNTLAGTALIEFEETEEQKNNNNERTYSFFALIIVLLTIWFIFEYIYKIGGPFKPASFILSAFIIATLLVTTSLNVYQIGILVIVLLGIGAGNLGKAFDKIKEVK